MPCCSSPLWATKAVVFVTLKRRQQQQQLSWRTNKSFFCCNLKCRTTKCKEGGFPCLNDHCSLHSQVWWVAFTHTRVYACYIKSFLNHFVPRQCRIIERSPPASFLRSCLFAHSSVCHSASLLIWTLPLGLDYLAYTRPARPAANTSRRPAFAPLSEPGDHNAAAGDMLCRPLPVTAPQAM